MSRKSQGNTSDASVNGTTMKVTTGIATALATGETSETCWNSISISGTRPSVIAHCARAAAPRVDPAPMRPTPV